MPVRLTVEIDGEQVPYDQLHWVISSPEGLPTGFMHVGREDLSNDTARAFVGPRTAVPERAWARFWGMWQDDSAIAMALKGYTIKLVHQRDVGALLDQHLGKVPVGQDRPPEEEESK